MSLATYGLLALQFLFLYAAAIAFGSLARLLKQPAVLGELAGGIIIGPTVLGVLAPGMFQGLFTLNLEALLMREAAVKIGLLFFLFLVGLEMDMPGLWRQRRVVAGSTLLGIGVPFLFGFYAVQFFPALWNLPDGQNDPFLVGAFIGTALSISALPVIARILKDVQLFQTPFGAMVMASATLTDIVGWIMFAVILKSHSGTVPAVVIDLTLGAFLLGVVCAPFWHKEGRFQKNFHWAVLRIAAPVYFISVGLKVNFIANFDIALVLAVFLIACLGKVIGVAAGALWAGTPFKKSLAAGFALNARGAMEIVLATAALESGLIDERIFVALFVMALATSILSGPMMQRFLEQGQKAS